jgi:hypothetical protein
MVGYRAFAAGLLGESQLELRFVLEQRKTVDAAPKALRPPQSDRQWSQRSDSNNPSAAFALVCFDSLA